MVQKMRASLLKLSKKSFKFRMSGAPDNWRIEVPAIAPETFAALVGRPQDTTLQTFVKKGAYYSVDAQASNFFPEGAELSRYFSREGVPIAMNERIVVKCKNSTMDLSISGSGSIDCF